MMSIGYRLLQNEVGDPIEAFLQLRSWHGNQLEAGSVSGRGALLGFQDSHKSCRGHTPLLLHFDIHHGERLVEVDGKASAWLSNPLWTASQCICFLRGFGT